MKRTIFLKVFGGFLLLILAFACLLLLFSLSTMKNFYIDTLAHDLENLGLALKLKVIPLLDEGKPEMLDAFVKKFGSKINTRITIVDREGRVLADTEEDPETMNNHKFRPEIAAALLGRKGRSVRFSNTVGADMLYVGLPIEREGQLSEVLRVSLYVKDIERLYAGIRASIWRIIIILSLLSMAGAFFFSRNLSRPIKKMKSASERIASGDFGTRVFLKNRDELKDLADGMNAMAERIQHSFNEMSRQKEELNSILASMADALLAIDERGKIRFANEIFREIFQVESPEGKFYWEAVRHREFSDFIKDVQQEKKNATKEIEKGDRIFLCSASMLSSRQDVLISMHDLTETRRVEQMKKDFVANVSHELRTPLTAIMGFVETLKDEIDEKNRNAVEIIARNTNRLNHIVKDLLLLSQLEEEQKLEYGQVDCRTMIENILKIFVQEIKKKDLSTKIHVDPAFPIIQGDPFRLEQMFVNIIDNAVKYTPKGKIEIFLERKNNEFVSIGIQDTGIGIPEEHVPRIFERFYVADKSRSRKLGGTGLGLAIVKHISLLHDGKVTVESKLGEGTKVTVVLPAKPFR